METRELLLLMLLDGSYDFNLTNLQVSGMQALIAEGNIILVDGLPNLTVKGLAATIEALGMMKNKAHNLFYATTRKHYDFDPNYHVPSTDLRPVDFKALEGLYGTDASHD